MDGVKLAHGTNTLSLLHAHSRALRLEAGPSVKLTMKIGRPTSRNAQRIPKYPACEQQQPGRRVGGGFQAA